MVANCQHAQKHPSSASLDEVQIGNLQPCYRLFSWFGSIASKQKVTLQQDTCRISTMTRKRHTQLVIKGHVLACFSLVRHSSIRKAKVTFSPLRRSGNIYRKSVLSQWAHRNAFTCNGPTWLLQNWRLTKKLESWVEWQQKCDIGGCAAISRYSRINWTESYTFHKKLHRNCHHLGTERLDTKSVLFRRNYQPHHDKANNCLLWGRWGCCKILRIGTIKGIHFQGKELLVRTTRNVKPH